MRKIKQLTNKEALTEKTMTNLIEFKKSLDVKVQVVEGGTNTNPIDIIYQKDSNPIKVGIS